MSHQTGRVYYLNSKTGEISYELPSMPARTREDEIAELEIQEHAAAIRIQAAYRGSRERRMVEAALEEELEDEAVALRRKRQQQKKRQMFLDSTEGIPPPMM